ncbi:hypothetical protein AOLI_G00152090 [Acnodon oligacanthus]
MPAPSPTACSNTIRFGGNFSDPISGKCVSPAGKNAPSSRTPCPRPQLPLIRQNGIIFAAEALRETRQALLADRTTPGKASLQSSAQHYRVQLFRRVSYPPVFHAQLETDINPQRISASSGNGVQKLRPPPHRHGDQPCPRHWSFSQAFGPVPRHSERRLDEMQISPLVRSTERMERSNMEHRRA